MSKAPPVFLPEVDLHEELPPISTLLSSQQNANIHRARTKYGAYHVPMHLAL